MECKKCHGERTYLDCHSCGLRNLSCSDAGCEANTKNCKHCKGTGVEPEEDV